MRHQRVPLAFASLWIALVIAFETLKPPAYDGPGLCMFRNVTSCPCPTCGGTRAAFTAAQGDLAGAFMLNPLVVMAGIAALGWLMLRIVFGCTIRLMWSPAAQIWITIGVVALLAGNWAWVLWQAS
jgi:hypothetical protein